MDLVHSIHKRMVNEQLMFAFRGPITEKNSLPLVSLIENEMIKYSYGIAGRKRLFMFVLESLQNIIRHGDPKYADMSIITYSRKDDGYSITTGNMIEASQVEDLEKRLNQINTLDGSAIKAQYLQILNNSGLSKKGGAGLGLFEMAVKTGNKLDYDFIPFNKNHSYFVLSKTVDSSGKGVSSGDRINHFKSVSVTRIQKIMSENNIYMIWSDNFSQEVGDDVLTITDNRLTENDFKNSLRKKIFNIQVEILENVTKYNPVRNADEKIGLPVIMVGLDNGKFFLSSGNLIHTTEIDNLRFKLDSINDKNKTELKEFFKRSLSEQTIDNDRTGNLGLINIALKSGNPLNYNFEQVNSHYSYFTLTVKVDKN